MKEWLTRIMKQMPIEIKMPGTRSILVCNSSLSDEDEQFLSTTKDTKNTKIETPIFDFVLFVSFVVH